MAAAATIGSSKNTFFHIADPPVRENQTAFLPRCGAIQIARYSRFANLHA